MKERSWPEAVPTKTCEAALMLGKGKSQGSIYPSHDLKLKSARLVDTGLVRTLANFPDE